MALDPDILNLVTHNVVGDIFKHVVNSRFIKFQDLIQQTKVDRREAREALQVLKQKNLIEERPSAIEDFGTFYVTASGLETKRKAGL